MANSDDPPFLTIGTEVSAKYRGAFCEATIKVAKKLVRCKVSYAKGQTALVNNDVIKGPLKVGSQVEVKQQDGQFLVATINKLTDQSTYTVVFDDGDERTLKRSSLCLKGARHFHESESLDNQPLTDPENFGAPVKKPGRKRRRLSPGSSQEEEIVVKRKCTYPPEFPVGKAVFLENDRRRSGWLPAVIVPAHYVMDESEMTPDTICLRSFKDGRFFAATKNELHDFSPDKEPLLSMLEGEIQAMYLCKPAIERATAYLDTGELPWDMDLFDKTSERPSPLRPRDHTSSDKEDAQSPEDVAAEREDFMRRYNGFMESRGTPVSRPAMMGQKDLDLYRLYKLVNEKGGMDRVTQEMKWRSIHLQLGMPTIANASHAISRAYKRYLHSFEMFEKGKGPKPAKDQAAKQTRKRLPTVTMETSDEEQPQSDKPAEKVTPKVTRTTKMEPKIKMEKIESPLKSSPRAERKLASLSIEKVSRVDKQVRPVKQVPKEPTASEDDDVISQGTDVKSEMSDQEGPPINGGRIFSDDLPENPSGVVHCPGEYAENDNVMVWYGKGKSLRMYQAKIQGIEESAEGRSYLVHYNGWNNRYNEWIEERRLAGKITGEVKPTRPHFSKKNKKKPKPPSTPRATDSTTPSPAPSPIVESSDKSTTPNPLPNETTTPAPRSKVKEETKETPLKKTPQSTKAPTTNGPGSGGVRKPRAKKRNRSMSETDGSRTSPETNEAISLDNGHKTPRLSSPTDPPPSLPPKAAEPSSSPSSQTSWSEQISEPSNEPSTDIDEGIQVKREDTSCLGSWDSLRGSTSSSGHGSLSSGGSESGEEGLGRDLGGLAAVVAAADALVCAEKVPDIVSVKPHPFRRADSDISVDGLSVLATQASHHTHSMTHTHSTHGSPTTNSSVESTRNPSESAALAKEASSPLTHSHPHRATNGDIPNGLDLEDSMGTSLPEKKPGTDDKQATPPRDLNGRVKRKGSNSPVGKRKYYESVEEYEAKKLVRRAELNFKIDFSQLPEMTREERTVLIQQKIRKLQSRWMELRSEVAYLERKKRRARRKERETARLQAVTTNPPPTTSNDSSLQPPVECH